MTPPDFFILGIASFAANFLSSIAGGGAGLLQFPVILFLGFPFVVAPANQNSIFPAEVQVQSVGNVRPRGKISVFLVGESDFLLATCTREVKFQFSRRDAGSECGECASARRNSRFFGRRA